MQYRATWKILLWHVSAFSLHKILAKTEKVGYSSENFRVKCAEVCKGKFPLCNFL